MIVLGIDTATASTSVALMLADGSISEARDDPQSGEHPGHATRLLQMAHQLISDAHVSWSEVQRIAVGVGPGTFTGLRVGVATARGLAQSLSSQLVGVSSLEALAVGAFAHGPDPDAVMAVIDARRGEVFAAAYQRSAHDQPRELAAARALAPDRLHSLVDEANGAIAQAQDANASHTPSWLAVGDGAIRYSRQLGDAQIPMAPATSPLHMVSASAICRLALQRPPAAAYEEIVPDYRRRPDAELALDTATPGKGA